MQQIYHKAPMEKRYVKTFPKIGRSLAFDEYLFWKITSGDCFCTIVFLIF